MVINIETVNVNYLAVLVSGASAMVIGYLWYGPLFGKPWMKLVGVTAKDIEEGKKDMPKTYGLMFVTALIMAYVLLHTLVLTGADSLNLYLQGAFWTWLGFIATTFFSGVLFNKKPIKLYAIEVGYYLITVLVMSGIFFYLR